jgi:uncharacterized peroxidase-related enzyme
MAHMQPLPLGAKPELADLFELIQASGAQVPNLYLTLARRPPILRAVAALGAAVMGPGTVSAELKTLVAFVASNTAGCRFCSAHTSRQAVVANVSMEKLQRAFAYSDDPVFEPAERAALRMARDSALHPGAVTAQHFAELGLYFTEEQIMELVAVTCLFAFMNRWHDIVDTDLEPGYEEFIAQHLVPNGWQSPPAGR